MRKLIIPIIALSMASVVLPSCVAKKKYLAAQSANADLRRRNDALAADLSRTNDSLQRLGNNADILRDVYNVTNNELNMSKEQIRDQQRRLQQLQNLITAQQRNTEALRKKIADALVNFKADELTVTMKNGKVYVSMQENLLFPSGSAVVNQNGKNALAKVAGVLNTNPDITVEVEGHTDNKPIKTTKYRDNWDLSTARAVSIAHVLIDEYQVPATKVKASGRGEFMPVATNNTEPGRAQNRRTEVILEPKLDELMDLIRGVPITTTTSR